MKMNRRDFIKAGTGAFFVSTASISALPVVSGAPAGKLSLVWPREGASVSLLTDAQKAYFEAPKGFYVELERGDPAVAERIMELLADGPMRPLALRKAVGIRNCTHFNLKKAVEIFL